MNWQQDSTNRSRSIFEKVLIKTFDVFWITLTTWTWIETTEIIARPCSWHPPCLLILFFYSCLHCLLPSAGLFQSDESGIAHTSLRMSTKQAQIWRQSIAFSQHLSSSEDQL